MSDPQKNIYKKICNCLAGLRTCCATIRTHRPIGVTVHGQAFSELKMPYDTVVVTDFADLECEASAKSVAVCATREQ